jgi:hypothetical protein
MAGCKYTSGDAMSSNQGERGDREGSIASLEPYRA